MIRTLSQKEFISALRDKRFIILGGIVIALLVLASITGVMSYNQVAAERNIAQQTATEDFRNAPARHPHRMAHYGSYAFRPKSSLSFFDFGLDSYTGTMVYLEAHQQNSANFSSVQQSGTLMRFGEMTLAFVLQWLIPLLIIFLCFNAFTQEKEQETIKVLLSQGLSVGRIANAKLKGYGKVLLLIIIPAMLTASLFLMLANNLSVNADFGFRLLLFFSVYALYFFIFLAGSILVSAWSRHSRTALLTLLGIWITACVIMPKMTANLGSLLYQTPTKAEMDAHVHHAASKGIDGHNPQDKRTEAFTRSLLQKYGVDSVSQLPVNIDGLVMAEGEAYSSKVYAQEFDRLAQTYGQQNAVSEWAGFINPFLSVRYISMGLAGTDQQHYVHFLKAAEEYRYRLAQHMNTLQATKLHYHDKDTRLDASNWKNYPAFEYRQPPVSFILSAHLISFAALLLWGLILYLVFHTLINRYFTL
jgi:ABC-2 type transport system permease protein